MHRNLSIVELAEWTKKRGVPYFEVTGEDFLIAAPRQLDPRAPRAGAAYMRSRVYCGKLNDCQHIGGSPLGGTSLFATDDDCLICYGMTHRDYDVWFFLRDELVDLAENSCTLNLAPPEFSVREECIYFGGYRNFGHFIFENLSRLAVLAAIDGVQSLKLAVYDDLPYRFFEFLELAGYGPERLLRIPRARTIEFHNVWAPSCPFYRDKNSVPHVWPAAYHFLRWKLAGALRKDRTNGRARVYLSRHAARWKRVVNDSEVVTYLSKEGFQIVDLAEMSAADQLTLIANAEMIVGPIGAAMAITLFAPEDCAVIELHSEVETAGLYNSIGQAHWLGQPYHRITGTRVLLNDNKSEEAIFHDFAVDLNKLRLAVELAKRSKYG